MHCEGHILTLSSRRWKLEEDGVNSNLTACIINYLTNRRQYVRLKCYICDVSVCSAGADLSLPLLQVNF